MKIIGGRVFVFSEHDPVKKYLFKVKIETPEKGVRYAQSYQ